MCVRQRQNVIVDGTSPEGDDAEETKPMKESFKPYIPADRGIPEMTPLSMVLGFALAVIFGAANAYLGLRVGMTVSASIPAAVISMAVIRVIMRRNSILENNMVQTIGSAGEALAGGAIFTMPALFIWENEGAIEKIPVISIAGIALLGGLLGVFFMVPLRRALIVKEHGVLPYPEGTACAEVLLAGEGGRSSAASVFQGMGIAAAVKFLIDGLKLSDSVIMFKLGFLKTEFATEVYPSLISVGFICGTRISAYMFAGGVIGWLVLISVIALFGSNMVMYPASVPVSELYAAGGAEALWAAYVKYIGAGAVATAGIISLIQAIPLIARTFAEAMRSIRSGGSGAGERTGQDLDMRIVLGG